MTTVNSRVFAENPIRYLNMATQEQVAVKRGRRVFLLVLRNEEPQEKFENISPSGDPFWADPRNVAELERRLKRRDAGLEKSVPLTRELRRELLGL